MGPSRFSERHGFEPYPAEVTVQYDAPHELRGVVVEFAYAAGLGPHALRTLVCRVLMRRPDENNWSAFPNVDDEVKGLLDDSEWFEVYDVIEAISEALPRRGPDILSEVSGDSPRSEFAAAINKYFLKRGIGWQLVDGKIEIRGSETFEVVVRPAIDQLQSAGLTAASRELHEALSDLARRPEPDITGSIQHSLAALECVAREATGDAKATLGDILAKYPDLVPRPLDQALSKLWGYGSEMARHIREGRSASLEEATLTVMTAAAVASYLERKLRALA